MFFFFLVLLLCCVAAAVALEGAIKYLFIITILVFGILVIEKISEIKKNISKGLGVDGENICICIAEVVACVLVCAAFYFFFG